MNLCVITIIIILLLVCRGNILYIEESLSIIIVLAKNDIQIVLDLDLGYSSWRCWFVQRVEEPFILAVREELGDRFTISVETIYRTTIRYILSTLTVEFRQSRLQSQQPASVGQLNNVAIGDWADRDGGRVCFSQSDAKPTLSRRLRKLVVVIVVDSSHTVRWPTVRRHVCVDVRFGSVWCSSSTRGERYDGTSSRTGPLRPKELKKIDLKDTRPNTNKNIFKKCKGGDALGRRCLLSGSFCSAWAGFFDRNGPVFPFSQLGKTSRPGTWLHSGRLTCSSRTGFRAVTTPLLIHNHNYKLFCRASYNTGRQRLTKKCNA